MVFDAEKSVQNLECIQHKLPHHNMEYTLEI